MDHIKTALSFLWRQKGKFFLSLLSAGVFLIFLFPYGDLTDFVISQISKFTHNSLYVDFHNFGVRLFSPGLWFENLSVEAPLLPKVQVQELTVSPSILSLLLQKPGGRLSAKGLLKGDLEVSLSGGPKSETGQERKTIQISAQKLSLEELADLAQLPLSVKGTLSLDTKALADLSLQEPPDVEMTLSVDKFKLPTSNVETPMGVLSIPGLNLSTVQIRGRLSLGKLQIQESLFGKEGDDIFGRFKGSLDLQLGPQLRLIPGGYDFQLQFTTTAIFNEKAKSFLYLLDAYKTPLPKGGNRFSLRISAPNPMGPPNFQKTQVWGPN